MTRWLREPLTAFRDWRRRRRHAWRGGSLRCAGRRGLGAYWLPAFSFRRGAAR